MEDLTFLVARNLKKMREEKKLSLDKLADLTGVSKSMLGQIERGESSPTISTVWKISNGLKVSFTDLLNSPQSDAGLVRKKDIRPLVEDNGKYRLFPFFPIEEGRRFEVYVVEIDSGGELIAEAHPEDTQEFITVFAGELTVKVNGDSYQVGTGDSIRFKADRAHIYQNLAKDTVIISLIIGYAP
jgi:transcriptional regulator with XRE-family HTH domain